MILHVFAKRCIIVISTETFKIKLLGFIEGNTVLLHVL